MRSLRQAVAALQALLASLRRACGYEAHKVHLLGFSQGGTVALELARQQQAAGQPLGSCVAVSAALLPEQLAQGGGAGGERRSPGGGHATDVLITHGSADKGGPCSGLLGGGFTLCLFVYDPLHVAHCLPGSLRRAVPSHGGPVLQS